MLIVATIMKNHDLPVFIMVDKSLVSFPSSPSPLFNKTSTDPLQTSLLLPEWEVTH